jgi:hypothetical protein
MPERPEMQATHLDRAPSETEASVSHTAAFIGPTVAHTALREKEMQHRAQRHYVFVGGMWGGFLAHAPRSFQAADCPCVVAEASEVDRGVQGEGVWTRRPRDPRDVAW